MSGAGTGGGDSTGQRVNRTVRYVTCLVVTSFSTCEMTRHVLLRLWHIGTTMCNPHRSTAVAVHIQFTGNVPACRHHCHTTPTPRRQSWRRRPPGGVEHTTTEDPRSSRRGGRNGSGASSSSPGVQDSRLRACGYEGGTAVAAAAGAGVVCARSKKGTSNTCTSRRGGPSLYAQDDTARGIEWSKKILQAVDSPQLCCCGILPDRYCCTFTCCTASVSEDMRWGCACH